MSISRLFARVKKPDYLSVPAIAQLHLQRNVNGRIRAANGEEQQKQMERPFLNWTNVIQGILQRKNQLNQKKQPKQHGALKPGFFRPIALIRPFQNRVQVFSDLGGRQTFRRIVSGIVHQRRDAAAIHVPGGRGVQPGRVNGVAHIDASLC